MPKKITVTDEGFLRVQDQAARILDPLFHKWYLEFAGVEADQKPVAKVTIHLFEDTFCNLWDLIVHPDLRGCYIRSTRPLGPEEKSGQMVVECKAELKLFERKK